MEKALTSEVTHLIASEWGSKKCKVAFDLGKPVMTNDWVDQVLLWLLFSLRDLVPCVLFCFFLPKVSLLSFPLPIVPLMFILPPPPPSLPSPLSSSCSCSCSSSSCSWWRCCCCCSSSLRSHEGYGDGVVKIHVSSI